MLSLNANIYSMLDITLYANFKLKGRKNTTPAKLADQQVVDSLWKGPGRTCFGLRAPTCTTLSHIMHMPLTL